MPDPQEQRDFRDCVAAFATGVCVVTTHRHDRPAGMTLNSFTSVSLDPMLIVVSLAHGTRTLETVAASERFAVSILHRRQRDTALAFAKRGGEFPLDHAVKDPHGYWVVPHSLAILRCHVDAGGARRRSRPRARRGGSLRGLRGEPLIFHRGAFGGLDEDALVPAGRTIGFESF